MRFWWSATVHEPYYCLLVTPIDVRRYAPADFARVVGGHKKIIRAASLGLHHHVERCAYDRGAAAAHVERDCIGRDVLVLGPGILAAMVACEGTIPDAGRWMRRLFTDPAEADHAANDAARKLEAGGCATVERVPVRA